MIFPLFLSVAASEMVASETGKSAPVAKPTNKVPISNK
ncbi:hypothetical protein SB6419_00903 [Klebsiella spallanzanii]|nr:hypothetical protein SB6419_00903 [Klebsiella spallanzanii]